MYTPRGALILLVLAASLSGARVMRPARALAVAGDVLGGSIVCRMHLAYDHTFTSGSGTDSETVSARGQMDISYTFIFIGAGSPIYEHARFTYAGSYRDTAARSQTDSRATAAGSLDAPSTLHPEDVFGENEIAQQPGGPYSLGPFGGPIPVSGTGKWTYTSGANIITQARTLHGEVQAYDASGRLGTIPAGTHPALAGMTTRPVNQDTLNQGVPEIPPGLAPGTTVTGYNRCAWHLIFIVLNGQPVGTPSTPTEPPTVTATATIGPITATSTVTPTTSTTCGMENAPGYAAPTPPPLSEAGVVAAAPAASQAVGKKKRTTPGTATIRWHSTPQLTWADFMAPPPAGSSYSAMTTSRLGASIGHDRYEGCPDPATGHLKTTVHFTLGSRDAYFYPAQSWVKYAEASAYVLNHEQRHFDITEVYARRLYDQALTLLGGTTTRTFTCVPWAQCERQVNALTAQLIQTLHQVEVEWGRIEADYDSTTDHSRNHEQQAAWNTKIDGWLAAPATAP